MFGSSLLVEFGRRGEDDAATSQSKTGPRCPRTRRWRAGIGPRGRRGFVTGSSIRCCGSGDLAVGGPQAPLTNRGVRRANARPTVRPSAPTPVTPTRRCGIDLGRRRRSPRAGREAPGTALGVAAGRNQHGQQRCDLLRRRVALRDLYHCQLSEGHVAVFAVWGGRSFGAQHVK